MNKFFVIFILITRWVVLDVCAQNQKNLIKIGLLKYNGGGDWYANLETSLPNLIAFCNKNLGTYISKEQEIIEAGSPHIFNLPFVHLTGHGNVIFSNEEALNLRNYLIAGGFLHISDNYGLDKYIRKAMKMVFPELLFQEISSNHVIFKRPFNFPNGLIKIHEHNDNPSKAYGLFYKGRMICFYDYESDLGDGWESAEVHNDTEVVRQKALKMGANIINYCFTQ